jgi:hypothetical protein
MTIYCNSIHLNIDRLRAVLREQLIKSGWRDALKLECRKVVQEQGLDNISVDEIIKQVTPHARGKSSPTNYLLTWTSCC